MRFGITARGFPGDRKLPTGWIRCLEMCLASRVGPLPLGPFGGWLEVRFVATAPKATRMAGRSTIVERLLVEVVVPVEAVQTFDHARFSKAFDAIRRTVRGLTGDSLAAREGYDIPALIAAFDGSDMPMPTDDASLARLARDLETTGYLGVGSGEERWRAEHPRPLDYALHGLRAYGALGGLMTEVNVVLVCLEAQLRDRGVKLPGYREIYFQVAPTLEAARLGCARGEWWFWRTPTVLDPGRCLEQAEDRRCSQILDAFEAGLLRLAEIDHLDAQAMSSACSELRGGGFEREIGLLSAENVTHRAIVFHEARVTSRARYRFYLRVVDKGTGRTALRELGLHQDTFAGHLFGKLQLTKSSVRVSGRKSMTADASRSVEQAPERWEYAMNDLFPSP